MLDDKGVENIANALRPDIVDAQRRFALHGTAVTTALKRFVQIQSAMDYVDNFFYTDGLPDDGDSLSPSLRKAADAHMRLYNKDLYLAVERIQTNEAVGTSVTPSYAYFGFPDGQVGRLYLVDENKIKDPRYKTLDKAMDTSKLGPADRAALRAICEAHAVASRTFIIDQTGEFEAKWQDFVRTEALRTFEEYLFPSINKLHAREMEMRRIFFRAKEAHLDFVKLCQRARQPLGTFHSKTDIIWSRHPELRVFSQHDVTFGQATIQFFKAVLKA